MHDYHFAFGYCQLSNYNIFNMIIPSFDGSSVYRKEIVTLQNVFVTVSSAPDGYPPSTANRDILWQSDGRPHSYLRHLIHQFVHYRCTSVVTHRRVGHQLNTGLDVVTVRCYESVGVDGRLILRFRIGTIGTSAIGTCWCS